MPLADHDAVVKALPPNLINQPLGIRHDLIPNDTVGTSSMPHA